MKVFATIPQNLARYFIPEEISKVTGIFRTHMTCGGYLEFYKSEETALNLRGPADKFLLEVELPNNIGVDHGQFVNISAAQFPNNWETTWRLLENKNKYWRFKGGKLDGCNI